MLLELYPPSQAFARAAAAGGKYSILSKFLLYARGYFLNFSEKVSERAVFPCA
jgi:hypothetical protein